MANWDNRSVAKSSVVLAMMYVAKLAFPLITLPYLTRVLSTECYGTVAYVRAVMVYMETFVDFGFVLSATKRVVDAADDRERLSAVVGTTLTAKLVLSILALGFLSLAIGVLPILREHSVYTCLSFSVVVLSVFLADFLFRGLARMHVVTIRFIIMRGIATALVFALVRGDDDLVLIPILDLIGTLVAVAFVAREARRCGVGFRLSGFEKVLARIRESSVYFIATAADTSFNVLSTVALGAMLSRGEVAYFAVCLQLIGVVQAMYAPIMESVYPAMVQRRDFSLIFRLLKLAFPVITIGCCLAYVLAPWGLTVVGGRDYVRAAGVYRALIPVLLFSFPVMLLGWPTLGAIGQQAKNSKTAVIAVIIQAGGLGLLAATGHFCLLNVALLRSGTELVLLLLRLGYCWKYRLELTPAAGT